MRRFVSIICAAVGGCSTAQTYILRPTVEDNLPEYARTQAQFATVSMDASRRLMIARLGNSPASCSEPPPDTATSLLAATAANANVNSKAGASAAAAVSDVFSTNAEMIATRTAAIEFWRTTSFEYCQLLMNGNKAEAVDYLNAAEAIAPEFQQSGEQAQSSAAQLLKAVGSVNQWEVQSSQLASTSKSPAVAQFASTAKADWNQLDSQISSAATGAGLAPPPEALLPADLTKLNLLRTIDSAEFDTMYAQLQMELHGAGSEAVSTLCC